MDTESITESILNRYFLKFGMQIINNAVSKKNLIYAARPFYATCYINSEVNLKIKPRVNSEVNLELKPGVNSEVNLEIYIDLR